MRPAPDEDLDRVAAGIDSTTGTFPVDTGDPAAVAALPDQVAKSLGPIEILVLNTGGPPPGGALEAPPEEWRSAYQSLVLTPLMLAAGLRSRHARAGLGADRQRLIDLGP